MQTISQPVVRVSRHGKIAVVTIDNPPVNALSDTVRASLLHMLRELAEDPTVAAVVLTGQNGQFVAGADIREMSRPPAQPFLPEVVAAIDAMKKPILAAIDGAALGEGWSSPSHVIFVLALSVVVWGCQKQNWGLFPVLAVRNACLD